MRQADYLVIERENAWWVMLDGFRRGPHVSRQVAIDSAVSSAKIDFKGGKTARVSVESGTDLVTVYDSDTD